MFLDLNVGDLVEPLSGRRWDKKETAGQVSRRAARFRKMGLLPGDRVFILFGNKPEFFAELLAVWRMGACPIPVDSRLTPFEAENLAKAASPKIAVVDENSTSSQTAQALSRLGVMVVHTLENSPEEDLPSYVMLEQDALMLFTSGSTGDPKGVVHTHRSLRARWISLRDHLGLSAFKRTLCILPTHFGHGLICNCLFPWLSGQDLYIAPPFRHELVMRLGKLVDENEITFLSSVPAIWRMALKLARPPERGTLARVHCGSAPLSAHMWEDIRKWAGTRHVCNAYGITETGSWVAGLSDASVPAEDGLIGPGWGAVVRVLKSNEVQGALDPELCCDVGEEGFVWLNTPALMRGYFNREDLTSENVVNGWFRTGDKGFLDERGWLTLRGRVRDEINKGGMKVFPSDVDCVVERFHATVDVCTFAIDDPLYGQNIGMAVVLSDKGEDTIRSLYAWMKEHLAEAKLPVRWWLMEEIPRTSRGKVNRDSVKASCEGRSPLDLAGILARGKGP
ncbi:MAG: class I adenylate-forming enzyme family protein [bacterium]